MSANPFSHLPQTHKRFLHGILRIVGQFLPVKETLAEIHQFRRFFQQVRGECDARRPFLWLDFRFISRFNINYTDVFNLFTK